MKTNTYSLLAFLLFLVSVTILVPACSDDDDDGDGPVDSEMALIPAGSFSMGDVSGTKEPNERPVRQVSINAFYMSKLEVTQALYQTVMGVNPSHTKGDKRPVENITWFQALEFCNALSARDGYTPVYADISGNLTANNSANGYRLPTEAEWEYACKAGTSTSYYNGDAKSDLDKVGWYSGNAGGTTHDVGTLAANSHGLFDMHGNVNEWCWDWYSRTYYNEGVNNNPQGPTGGDERVCRGGAYFVFEYACRSTFRSMLAPHIFSRDIGLRVVRNAN